jgi:hypothetical protein
MLGQTTRNRKENQVRNKQRLLPHGHIKFFLFAQDGGRCLLACTKSVKAICGLAFWQVGLVEHARQCEIERWQFRSGVLGESGFLDLAAKSAALKIRQFFTKSSTYTEHIHLHTYIHINYILVPLVSLRA